MRFSLGAARKARNVRELGPEVGEQFNAFEARYSFSRHERDYTRRVFAWLVRVVPEERAEALRAVVAYREITARGTEAVDLLTRKGILEQRLGNAEILLRRLLPDDPQIEEIRQWVDENRPRLDAYNKRIEENLAYVQEEQEWLSTEGQPFIYSFLRLPRLPIFIPTSDPEPD